MHLRISMPSPGLPRRLFTCQCRRCKFDPWVRKIHGEGSGNPLQNSCLENLMDREPGGLQSMGLGRDRCDLATNQQHASSILLTSAETLVFSNGATLEMYNWCVIH